MLREAWRAAIHGVTKSWTRLSDWTELNWTCPMTCYGSKINFKFLNFKFNTLHNLPCNFPFLPPVNSHLLLQILILSQNHLSFSSPQLCACPAWNALLYPVVLAPAWNALLHPVEFYRKCKGKLKNCCTNVVRYTLSEKWWVCHY